MREVALARTTTLAVTGAGRVVVWGSDGLTSAIPPEVNSLDVVDLAVGALNAGVVSRGGKVMVWGASPRAEPDPTEVPDGLGGVSQLAIAYEAAFALKQDGSVVAWGNDRPALGREGEDDPPLTGMLEPPAGLRASAISASYFNAYALTTEGTVAGWGQWWIPGDIDQALPAATQIPGNVTAVAAVSLGGVALLADGTITAWGHYGQHYPPDLAGKRAVAIAGGLGANYAVLDEDGVIHIGGYRPVGEDFLVPPVAVQGAPVAQFSIGSGRVGVIATDLLPAAPPFIAGNRQAGSILTGTQGTFSAVPDGVTNQWLLDGEPIAGATGPTLTVSAAMVGKRVSYRSTATKAGHDPVSSVASVVVTAPSSSAAGKVGSSTAVGKVTVAKKAAKVTVAGKVRANKSAAGTAVVTIAKGKKVIVTKTVPVAANGELVLKVKKFGKVVVKKTKSKKKSGYRGKYKVTIAYQGNAKVRASTGVGGFTIRR